MEMSRLERWVRRNFLWLIIGLGLALPVAIHLLRPGPEARSLSAEEACKKTCAPLAGTLEGQRGLPAASPNERRNHERFARCVCR